MTSRRALKRKLSTPSPEESIFPGIFSIIPPHNQMDVLRKLEFKDFVSFTKCSKETMEISTNFRYRLPLKVDLIQFSDKDITIRLYGNHRVTEAIFTDKTREFFPLPRNMNMRFIYRDFEKCFSLCEKWYHLEAKIFAICAPKCYNIDLEEFCRRMHCTTQTMTINTALDSTEFKTIGKLLKAEKIAIGASVPITEMISDPEVRTLNEIELEAGVKINESDFLRLLATKLTAYYEGTLTLSMINCFLKQWSEGKRSIENLFIRRFPSTHSEILADLEHTVRVKMGLPRLMTEKKEYTRVYSLPRADGKILFISITNTSFVHDYGKKRICWHLNARESDNNNVKEFLHSLRSNCHPTYQCCDCRWP